MYTPLPQLYRITRYGTDGSVEVMPPNGFDENLKPLPGTWESFKPSLDDPAGTNYQHRDEQTVFLVLDDSIYAYDVTITQQVLMSFGFPPVHIDDFFEDKIVENLANFFGIPHENIRYVEVIREDADVTSTRKKRQVDQGDAIGISVSFDAEGQADTEETNDSGESVSVSAGETLTRKSSELVSDFQTGATSGVEAVFQGTSVQNAEITSYTPPPPEDTEANVEATAAFNANMDGIITKNGRTLKSIHVANEIKKPTSMTLEGVDGITSIEERTPIYPSPKVKFLDQNGDLVNVGSFNDPWLIQAELIGSSDPTVIIDGTTQVGVFNGVADFHNLYMPKMAAGTYQIKFSIVYPESAKNSNLNQALLTSEFTVEDRTVTAEIESTVSETESGNTIEYFCRLLNMHGETLSDSNWNGYVYAAALQT